MKLTFLGTGSAFTVSGNYHSNMILESDTKKILLIDCGSDARHALNELGLSYRDIHSVYISHLHADHVGGLEWLAFTAKFDPAIQKPNLFISEHLVRDLWDKTLSGGLSSIQDEVVTLSSFFHVHAVKEQGFFNWEKTKFTLIQTLHVMSGHAILPSYGLMFAANDSNVFITTDTQYRPHQIHDFYDSANIIFQDCETSETKSHVHAHYDELVTLPEHIKEKMWLYHYNPCKLPDAARDGFRGFVQKGQCFDFSDKDTLF